MNTKTRIEPTEGNPEPLPPVGGQWTRDDDGGLRPSDRATAAAAGLSWPEEVAALDGAEVADAAAKKRVR